MGLLTYEDLEDARIRLENGFTFDFLVDRDLGLYQIRDNRTASIVFENADFAQSANHYRGLLGLTPIEFTDQNTRKDSGSHKQIFPIPDDEESRRNRLQKMWEDDYYSALECAHELGKHGIWMGKCTENALYVLHLHTGNNHTVLEFGSVADMRNPGADGENEYIAGIVMGKESVQ